MSDNDGSSAIVSNRPVVSSSSFSENDVGGQSSPWEVDCSNKSKSTPSPFSTLICFRFLLIFLLGVSM